MVEGEAAHLSHVRPPPQLLEHAAGERVHDAQDGALLRRCHQARAVEGEGERVEGGRVSLDGEGALQLEKLHPHHASVGAATDEDRVGRRGAQRTETLGVGDGVDLHHALEVLEVVHEHLVLQHHHNLVPSQPHPLRLLTQADVPDVLALDVIPNDDFVRREPPVVRSADQCEKVALEEHLDIADASTVQLSVDLFLEGAAVEDLESRVGPDRKTALILIESDVENLRLLSCSVWWC
mmetsp:Transcript_46821/g.111043  ORF Transcript_46821/g.111043 Transcript_46821/m.111043 type:complete len:237 (+) Transcript_46821:716-1426(+)